MQSSLSFRYNPRQAQLGVHNGHFQQQDIKSELESLLPLGPISPFSIHSQSTWIHHILYIVHPQISRLMLLIPLQKLILLFITFSLRNQRVSHPTPQMWYRQVSCHSTLICVDRASSWSHRAGWSSATPPVATWTVRRRAVHSRRSNGKRWTVRRWATSSASGECCGMVRCCCYHFRQPLIDRTSIIPCTGAWRRITWAGLSPEMSKSEQVSWETEGGEASRSQLTIVCM